MVRLTRVPRDPRCGVGQGQPIVTPHAINAQPLPAYFLYQGQLSRLMRMPLKFPEEFANAIRTTEPSGAHTGLRKLTAAHR